MTQPESNVDVAIVIPALEEADNLGSLLPRIHQQFAEGAALHSLTYSILPVVEIGSDDVDNLRELGCHPIERGPSNSFGDAMRTGIGAARHVSRYLLVMDADGSHPPETIPRLLEVALDTTRSQPDIVIASRYVTGGTSSNPGSLRFMSRLLNLTYALVLSLPVRDVSTNYKVYRSELFHDMHLTCDNFDIVEEILARLNFSRPNLRVVEVPDHFHERLHGVSKRRLGPFIFTYLLTLCRLRLELRRQSSNT